MSGFVISAGIIYAYNDYLSRLIEPVSTLFRDIGNLQLALVRTERIFAIDAEQEPTLNYLISGHCLIMYSSHTPKTNHVIGNYRYSSGKYGGYCWSSGSGKSTMMSLLLRFYDLKPTDMGKIYIDGVDITTHSRKYRKHLGIILQDQSFRRHHIQYPIGRCNR